MKNSELINILSSCGKLDLSKLEDKLHDIDEVDNLDKFVKRYGDKLNNFEELINLLYCMDGISSREYLESVLDFIFDTFRDKDRVNYVLKEAQDTDIRLNTYTILMGKKVWVNNIEYTVESGVFNNLKKNGKVVYKGIICIERDIVKGKTDIVCLSGNIDEDTRRLKPEDDKIKIIFF